jgi:hypothetical protein
MNICPNTDFVVYNKPINMHRSYDGLLTLVISELKIDPMKDAHVLFINRDRNQFKILFSLNGQISIFAMRLSGSMKMDFTQISKIKWSELDKLIKTLQSRKSRLGSVLELKIY